MEIPAPIVKQLLREGDEHRCDDAPDNCVRIRALANLPTRFGPYQVVAFENCLDKKDHAAFVHGNVFDQENVPVRVHSECLTGDAIGSLRCDCRDQLLESLSRIGQMELGVVLYLRQEGRGIGFANKIRAYQLQDAGYDTVQANEVLGFRPDERDYGLAAHMLRALHIRSISIITNNPSKVEDLRRNGVEIVDRIPLVIPPTEQNRQYLETKRKKMGHWLEMEQPGEPDESAPSVRR